MVPGQDACTCSHCDSVCEGRFTACADVWARGPRPVQLTGPALPADPLSDNGSLDHFHGWVSTERVVSNGGSPAMQTRTSLGTDASLDALDWPEGSVRVLRTELDDLARAMTRQQAVLTELVSAYGDLRRAPDQESLLVLVRTVVEDALLRHQSTLREDMAGDSRQLHELLTQIRELTADQRAQKVDLATAHEDLRAELHDALGRDRTELYEGLAASSGILRDVLAEVRQTAAELSAATVREVRKANTDADARFSDLRDSITELQDSARARQDTREVIERWLRAFADSMGDAVAKAVEQAVEQAEDRMAGRLERAIGQFQQALKDAEEVSERHRVEAAEAEGERARELQTGLMDLSDALRGTHALAAAQREEAELLDAAMSTLHQSLVHLETSVAAQHVELREDLARQRRSASALLKRQLRPITESLPELVAAAVTRSEEETVRRIERALAKLQRSVEQQGAGSRGRT